MPRFISHIATVMNPVILCMSKNVTPSHITNCSAEMEGKKTMVHPSVILTYKLGFLGATLKAEVSTCVLAISDI